MILKGRLVLEDKVVSGSLRIEDGRIKQVSESPIAPDRWEAMLDFGSSYIMPGFVDLHTHGSGGFDFMDGRAEDIIGAAKSHASHGTTTCLQPAELIGLDGDIGSIAEGKCADLVVCDDEINIEQVFIDGVPVKEKETK